MLSGNLPSRVNVSLVTSRRAPPSHQDDSSAPLEPAQSAPIMNAHTSVRRKECGCLLSMVTSPELEFLARVEVCAVEVSARHHADSTPAASAPQHSAARATHRCSAI